MAKNTGSDDINRVYCRVVFMDHDGVIKGDDLIQSVDSLPASRTKGPIILTGSLGYTNDLAFLPMLENPSERWQYELYVGDSYGGPWKKVESDVVELPPGYQRLSPTSTPQGKHI